MAEPLLAMLWDADGVLQHGHTDWRRVLDEVGGPGFAQAVFDAELPALRGEEPFADCLARVVRERGPLPLSVRDLLAMWEETRVDPGAMALVGEVRAAGTPCHLATNQQDHRRTWMLEVLGYTRHFDRFFWSCEVGALKPEPAYFERVLAALGLPAERVGFVDDSPANVEVARSLGLRAVRHDPAGGAEALRAEVGALLAAGGPARVTR